MSIIELLKVKDFKQVLAKGPVTFFKGPEYPFLFFSLLLNYLKTNKLDVSVIDIKQKDFVELQVSFGQYFLGNNLFYWLGDISEEKKKNEIIAYLNSNYNGPHSIGFFINDSSAQDFDISNCITCDLITNLDQFSPFLFLWPKEKHKVILQFINKIFDENNKLTIDQACMLANYSILLGNKNELFIDNWLDKILISEQSLFVLSKYFFARDAKSFYKYWDNICQNYAPIFWTSFWSEQIYRATNYIHFIKQGKNLQSKQIAYKLPFSFIQSDWKKLSVLELQRAHQFLYDIDFSLKNGGSEIIIDLFYAKYFSKEFAKI